MNHLEPDLVETRVSSPAFALPKVTNVMAKTGVPLLHAVAFSSPERRPSFPDGDQPVLSAAIPTAIQFQGFTPQAGAQVWTLSGNSPHGP